MTSMNEVLADEVDALTKANAALTAEIERAFQMLEINGVSRSRAKSLNNGIDVLVSRMSKEVQALTAENAEYKQKYLQMTQQYCRDLAKFADEDGNNLLAPQLDALAAQVVALREALQAMVNSARGHHCGLRIADEALAIDTLAAEAILAERDAKTLEEAYQWFAARTDHLFFLTNLRRMAAEKRKRAAT